MWQVIIASVGVFGSVLVFILGRRAEVHDRQRQQYARALSLVFKWQEMPYRILRRDRRQADQPLVDRFHDLQEEVAFYDAWIAVESDIISDAYRTLIKSVKSQAMPYLNDAWESEPPESQNVGNRYPLDVDQQKARFVKQVRQHFRLYGLARLVSGWGRRRHGG